MTTITFKTEETEITVSTDNVKELESMVETMTDAITIMGVAMGDKDMMNVSKAREAIKKPRTRTKARK